MTQNKEEHAEVLTRQGRLVVALSKTLFDRDVDGAFRVMGEYLDDNRLQVSEEVIQEYRFAERIKSTTR